MNPTAGRNVKFEIGNCHEAAVAYCTHSLSVFIFFPQGTRTSPYEGTSSHGISSETHSRVPLLIHQRGDRIHGANVQHIQLYKVNTTYEYILPNHFLVLVALVVVFSLFVW